MKKLAIASLFLLTAATLATARPELSNGRPGPTPYDPYNAPVHTVLRRLNGAGPGFQTVATLVRQGFSFRYSFDTPYLAQAPHVTEAKRSGDCKDKSLWLAAKMNDRNVRYVIGKATRASRISHAWLMWKHEGRWWVLDPTNNPNPIPADHVGPDQYLVLYSYDQNGSYCHDQAARPRNRVAGQN